MSIFRRQIKYNLDFIEGIQSIKIPKYKPIKGVQAPTDNIEYILQRKATEHKRNGKMNLAIACLRKSNEIFPYSNFIWSPKDYLRLVEFLKDAGKFDEARVEQARIEAFFQSNNLSENVFEKILSDCKLLGTDLVEMQDNNPNVCGECSKYQKRIFTISGKNKQFPVLPDYLKLNLPEHAYCFNSLYPYNLNISTLTWGYVGNLVTWSNRPFIDERTIEQKEYFKKWVSENEQEIIDRKNFDFLREYFPTIAPKSFGGYRRMKNLQSEKYITLNKSAKNEGIDLNQKPDLSIYKL